MTPVEAIQEEHRKIHRVQTLVDFAMHVLAHGDLARADAIQLVDEVRTRVLQLFPESSETFDVLYGRRFDQLVATCPELPPPSATGSEAARTRRVH
jgi:hypothetical protein